MKEMLVGFVCGGFAVGWITYVLAWGKGYHEGAVEERHRWLRIYGKVPQ